jgi:hypothetical protein
MLGGAGDDTWVNTLAYDPDRAELMGEVLYFGGDGNDYITN